MMEIETMMEMNDGGNPTTFNLPLTPQTSDASEAESDLDHSDFDHNSMDGHSKVCKFKFFFT
jgi:hypothetical protein